MIPFSKVIVPSLRRVKRLKPLRKLSACLVILAFMMPIAAPVPVWAIDLNLPRASDHGLRLKGDGSPFYESGITLFNNLFSGFAAFLVPKLKNDNESRTVFSVEALEKKIATIETQISDKQEVVLGQVLSLSAIPVDKNANPLNGLAVRWECSDSNVVKVINGSQAIAANSGEAVLTVRAGKITRQIRLSVTGKPATNSNRLKVAGKNHTTLLPPPDEPLMVESEAVNLVAPENNLGSPPGQTEMGSQSKASAIMTRERHGSSNYSFGVPIASLPGRGIDVSVGITYNSRAWNKSSSGESLVFGYNVDGNWLAPGFEMGFGELEGYSTGSGYGYLLTGPDGTRTQLIQKQVSGSCVTYESMDGTFIQTTICGVYAQSTILVKYADGSQVTYGAITQSGKRFPVTIQDRNGNIISITYVQGDSVGKIANIKDTLNRYITFHYDNTTEKKLVAVSVPGYDGSTTPRQTIRFYYEDLTLQTAGRFDSNATVNAPATVKVLRYVYFPGTQSGYKYDYSPYFGMVYKIWQMRGMQASTDSISETGTITSEGTAAASTHYNYAATAGELDPPLTDVPKYDIRYDDWQGRTTAIPETNFFTEESVTPSGCEISLGTCTGTRTTTVTAPDNTKSVSVSNIRLTGDWENGLLTEVSLVTEMGPTTVWSNTKLYWQQGDNQPAGRDNPRLAKIEVTNDAGQTRATSFEYDGYNNQTVVREHDFAAEGTLGTELRRTEATYETGAGWINNRQIRLPKTVQTIVNSNAVSKVTYEYDNYLGSPMADTPGVMQHNNTFSPFSGTYTCNCEWECPGGEIVSGQRQCSDGSTSVYICDQCPFYSPATAYRGNVTKVTAFADATLSSDPNAVITTMKYDITGNVIETGASCCKEKAWTYDLANGYAYPVTEEQGNAGQLETNVIYDRNTGLIKTATDENGQTATLTYNPDNLRLIRTDSPNGAWATTEYNDATFPYHVKSTASLDATRSVSSWSFVNGRGQGFRLRSQTTNGYLSNDAEFDEMGRAVKSFNPYSVANLADDRPSNIKSTVTTQRDGLGRALSVMLSDLTIVTATYSGLVATATDQAGKSRRRIADALGRTIRVDEPNAVGSLGDVNAPVQPTFYEYDGNNNLTKITQSDGTATQERLFKFDSLSRLTHERQVEGLPTLDNTGIKVGGGGLWTGFYKYDTEDLLLEVVDARGVKTAFTYDGLNRVSTIIYANETGYQTPPVSYTYDEAEMGFYNNGRLTKIRTAPNATYGTPETIQNYRYDKIGQITKHSQSIGNQVYQLEYGYNLAGQLVSEKYPSGKILTATVDNFGVTQAIADAQKTYLNGVTFDSRGTLSQIDLGNGTSETFSQNDRFQVISQSLIKGTNVLQKYDYSYGTTDLANGNVDSSKNNGQLSKIESWIGVNKQWSQRFGYDELGRLKESREYKQDDNAHLTYKQVFDFDRFGNLYRKSASNPVSGQENPLPVIWIEDTDISRTKNRFAAGTTYDDAGKVIEDNKFRAMTFAYDANGRIVKASKVNQLDAWTVYDGGGNRVAEKINDIWQFMIYDAFGHLVAEYGLASEGSGGVKYVHQDWQGSVRVITNRNGFVLARTDHQAFGEKIGAGVGLRSTAQGYAVDTVTRQSYGRTEKDKATGLNHAWFRKLEDRAGRWTSPDPSKSSMSVLDPQSFNRYSYVTNDPLNFVDPSGLYEACVHQAMAAALGRWAGLGNKVADALGRYAGGGPGGADSPAFKATSSFNVEKCLRGQGPSVEIHFPSAAQLQANIAAYPGYLAQGTESGYQKAGHMIHSIQDSLGAHAGFSNTACLGHATHAVGLSPFGGVKLRDPREVDRILGDGKFKAAANKVFQVMKNDPNASLSNAQLNLLMDGIKKFCGENVPLQITYYPTGVGGSGEGGGYLGGYGGGWSQADWSSFLFDLLFRMADQYREDADDGSRLG